MAGLTDRRYRRLTRIDRGTLYVVATPIGNLADASPRSIEVLRAARPDRLRGHAHHAHAARALRHRDAHRGAARAQRARSRARSLIAALRDGEQRRAGERRRHAGAVRSGRAAGRRRRTAPASRVSPVPGPSAAVAAFSAAGFAAAGFLFAGFLPRPAAHGARRSRRSTSPWPVVLYEAPHRIAADRRRPARRASAPAREIAIARELTQEVRGGRAPDARRGRSWLPAGRTASRASSCSSARRRRGRAQSLDARARARRAARVAAAERSGASSPRASPALPRNELYRKALERAQVESGRMDRLTHHAPGRLAPAPARRRGDGRGARRHARGASRARS